MTTIEQIMSTPVVTANAGETLAAVIQRMHDHRVGSVVVVDGSPDVASQTAKVIGVVTERDVLRRAAALHVDLGDVERTMTSPADVIDAGLDATAALRVMRERGYRHMPVVRAGELAGVVSLRDLMRITDLGPAEVPRGLKGVVVADTEVGDVRGSEGFYHYRQYSAVELATQRSLADVMRLMIDGALPVTEAERAGVQR